MPLRITDNTKRAPFKVSDLINRKDTAGAITLLNDDVTSKIFDDFIFYLTQSASYNFITGVQETDVLTACIYEKFKDRVLLDKFADSFEGWSESEDFETFVNMIKTTIENNLIANAEKYSKLYYSMVVEFNPLWNVDGTEITERELRHTGTDTREKTGSDSTSSSGTNGRDIDVSDTTSNTGTDTDTTQKTTYNDSSFYDTDKVTRGKNTTTAVTGSTVEEGEHSEESETTYNTKDKNTRDLTDVEVTKYTRGGNIGVTSTVTLLNEFRGYANFNFTEYVARDIINQITFLVY